MAFDFVGSILYIFGRLPAGSGQKDGHGKRLDGLGSDCQHFSND